MRYALMLAVWVLGAVPAAAQGDAVRDLLAALEGRVPGTTLGALKADPERFFVEAAGLVLGFGGPQGIDRDGIEDAIAAERARVRARELRRLLDGDLNGDLAVDGHELDVMLRAASATMRGRLIGWHGAADTDRDGTATWAELRAHAHRRAREALPQDKAGRMRALMVFDLDGDGRVSVPELREAVAHLVRPA